MGQRSMLCTNQMIDMEIDQQGQGYLHPEPCIFLGGIGGFPQPDIQAVMTAAGNTANSRHIPDHYESAMFYGIPQYHGGQHHQHAANLDQGIATAPNFYVPYMPPGSHGSTDQPPSSGNYGVNGMVSDEYERNNHFMDNNRGSFKRKNTEGFLGNSQYHNTSIASSSATPSNTRHPDGVAPTDGSSFALPTYRGTGTPSMREVGLQRSVRNRLVATAMDPVLAHNHNNFIQGNNYTGQPFQPPGPQWSDPQLSSNRSEGGPPAWSQPPAIPFMHRSSVSGGSVESRNMSIPRYHDTSSIRTPFPHPQQLNLPHHSFSHHPLPPMQGVRGQNSNVYPQVAAPSYRAPINYAPSSANSTQDGMETAPRHLGPVQPTGFRIYRPHLLHETAFRHRNFPNLRMMPNDGIAMLELPGYYDVGNYIDHHRDMRLDIEDMSYEELLALGERIGSVNTGLSEESIGSKLKTRIYLSSGINLEEAPPMDQESDSCMICQENYNNGENIGSLDCAHEYHADCLKKWLLVKNVCPVCKSEALAA